MGNNLEYALYVQEKGVTVQKIMYQDTPLWSLENSRNVESLQVRVFVREKGLDARKISKTVNIG